MLIKNLFARISFYYFVIITTAKGWRPYRLEFTDISSKSYVSYAEINSSISNNGAISIYINLFQDIPNMHAKAVMLLESSTGKYDLELVNKTVDVCKFFRNRKYEPILQVFYKALTKTGTFAKSCPIRKKLAFVKDVVLNPEDFPPVFPTGKGCMNLTLMSKNGNNLLPLYGFTIHVQTMQLDKTKK